MKKELIIFGANGALGKGISEVLLKKDYDEIFLFDFNVDDLPSSDKIKKIETGDLAVEENVIKAISNIHPSKDKIIFLSSTVGGYSGGNYIWNADIAELDKMININFKSAFFITKHFAKIVKNSGGGSICMTAAYSGVAPEPKKAAYSSAKAALIQLIKTTALEGKEINLSANAIAPYIIDTPANREWMKDTSVYENWVKPAEIGELIHSIFCHFNFITGNVINLTHRFKI